MSEYKAGESYLADWKHEYRWLRDAQLPTPEEIAEGKSDLKKTWRLFCKSDRHGAWIERRAIRAEARAAQLQAERDSAAYQATCEAARAVYDLAQCKKDRGQTILFGVLIEAFNKICEALT